MRLPDKQWLEKLEEELYEAVDLVERGFPNSDPYETLKNAIHYVMGVHKAKTT